MNALEIKNLSKTYNNKFQALKDISLNIKKGDFFALLGPNGAGKSTIINIISDLVIKTSGNITIFGHDMKKELSKAKSFIGLVPQEFNFGVFEKVIDIVINQAGYYGIKRSVAIKRAQIYLKKLGLWQKKDVQARMLSGGMKRRLMIARALMHQPKLLILDEPTAGVDIELRHDMWKFLKEINKKGITIILTTHYLEEAENLCKNIAIINHGKIIENTSIKSLLSRLKKQTYVLDLKDPIKKDLLKDIKNTSFINNCTIEIELKDKDNITDLLNMLKKKNIDVHSMKNKTNRLEELFMEIVKR